MKNMDKWEARKAAPGRRTSKRLRRKRSVQGSDLTGAGCYSERNANMESRREAALDGITVESRVISAVTRAADA